MKIKTLEIKNFRLLKDVSLSLEDDTTVIVGRNNSGKTSLTEIFRRLTGDKTPSFSLHDFSVPAITGFTNALHAKLAGEDDDVVRAEIPAIEIKITIQYPTEAVDLGVLGDFIIDLDVATNTITVAIQYLLKYGKINALFDGIEDESPESISLFHKSLKEKIPNLYETRIIAIDPNDPENAILMDYSKFKLLIGAGFINAQRGLDDVTHAEKDVLGKVLAKLFKTSTSVTAPADMKVQSDALKGIIDNIQGTVDADFNARLDLLMPALGLFGYPGLSDPTLSTETTIDISNILESHTKIRYAQGNNLFLPETYNGLGSRNLIYILFQLFEFFREYQSRSISNSLDIIFIEEPEAHLHPQMQQIFIRKLDEIAKEFSRTLNGGIAWPVQFVVTTHSTHIANEAKFESIRYFLTSTNAQRETTIKDLRKEFTVPALAADKEFLHKYLTLTKCDLYFADKAILIEGAVERIMMPLLITKSDATDITNPPLATQYVTTIEVGGAYAHHFYKFLDFLELRCLVITDLDSVSQAAGSTTYSGCLVNRGTHTSNAGIKNWFASGTQGHYPLPDCIAKTNEQKISGSRRIAFQIPENGMTAIGRSFEEALILANRTKFGVAGATGALIEANAESLAPNNKKKTEFALKYGLDDIIWQAPLYIVEGLQWLARNPIPPMAEVVVVNKPEE
ncbi:Predicted ATP-dependent endonuclease of the OLD family, contains P-loop ATPase and TOPRIM domains [Flavobacterium gillisiae]|uniref:Predicted ATP-dependent endonuclease of the OLD family, contains P-loop ATPase and TOPRIM domains n=1 Tax=Flavobacterium gillisiae TaxID=150146 RepID=A0A1H4FWH7_9FLAO|nr:ATP-dependent endonuclease [Flavobacterium gillisiae]SEB00988.1 Predicted ATP-dependent endonuclease of the OLD family, contains P-loop ATPase and TOPRIM domains [Flavobacterium gillisiae]